MACYTVDEVEAHNNSNDCWVIFKGKVYNVTPFLEDVKNNYYEVMIVLLIFNIASWRPRDCFRTCRYVLLNSSYLHIHL